MLSPDDLYGSDCKTKLDLATTLHRSLGARLSNAAISQSLMRLNDLALKLSEQMQVLELGPRCACCAAKPGGGCCSRAIAEENDAIQLLMNLMAGVPVEICRDNGTECLFLATQGCTLAFKPIFCLNYDCSAITKTAEAANYRHYERLRGQLLQEQWRLEQLLRDRLQELGELR